MDELYKYLKELSRCEWRADRSHGITYNGIGYEYGCEYYNKMLFEMHDKAERELLLLSYAEKKALQSKIFDIYEYPYDVITIEYVEALRRDSIGGANKEDILLGEYVVKMFGVQQYYRKKILDFINNILGNKVEVESKYNDSCVVEIVDDTKNESHFVNDNSGVLCGLNGLAAYLGCGKTLAQAVVNSGLLGSAQYRVGNKWFFYKEKIDAKKNDNPNLLKDVHIKRSK